MMGDAVLKFEYAGYMSGLTLPGHHGLTGKPLPGRLEITCLPGDQLHVPFPADAQIFDTLRKQMYPRKDSEGKLLPPKRLRITLTIEEED